MNIGFIALLQELINPNVENDISFVEFCVFLASIENGIAGLGFSAHGSREFCTQIDDGGILVRAQGATWTTVRRSNPRGRDGPKRLCRLQLLLEVGYSGRCRAELVFHILPTLGSLTEFIVESDDSLLKEVDHG